MVVEKNPNVYIDTAAYLYEIEALLDINLVERLGENKIIFGTDYPMPSGGKMHRMKDFVKRIKELKLPEGVKEKIFSENIAKLVDI
jgi:predicted TIM-barrel fold metal-dependent hydrolase